MGGALKGPGEERRTERDKKTIRDKGYYYKVQEIGQSSQGT